MTEPGDEVLMKRALELAARGRGTAEPNPLVGCVIARGDTLLGEGYHVQWGRPHAEAEALRACAEAGMSVRGATAHVTLEPCCHTNKRTPPCVPALISAGIARVVVGCADPNPQVSGQGMEQLAAAGVQVDRSPLEPSARQMNAPFFARVAHGRPYITLKWAQSADGKVAGPAGQRIWISNKESNRVVHRLRGRSDAIAVGINTVLMDDPLLTARHVGEARPLLRVVLDTRLRLPIESRLVRSVSEGPVLVYCDSAAAVSPKAGDLRSRGVQVVGHAPHQLAHVLQDLGQRDVTHLLVEAGPVLAQSFIRENLIDRVWVFASALTLNDPTAPAAPSIPYAAAGRVEVAGDVLTEYFNERSPVFFSLDSSPDFLLR